MEKLLGLHLAGTMLGLLHAFKGRVHLVGTLLFDPQAKGRSLVRGAKNVCTTH